MIKSKFKIISIVITLCVLLTSCTIGSPGDSSPIPSNPLVPSKDQAVQEKFDKLLDEFMVDLLCDSSEISYHYLFEHPENYGLEYKKYNVINYDALDMTDEEKSAETDKYKDFLKRLHDFNKSDLSVTQQNLYENFEYEFETMLEYGAIDEYGSMLGPKSGFISSMGSSMFYEYSFINEDDINNYLKFLKDVPKALSAIISYSEKQTKNGIVPSDYMLEENITTLKDYADESSTPFIDGFEQKIDNADFLSDEQKASFKEQNLEILKSEIFPAFTSTADTLSKWVGTLGEASTLPKLENGDKYYQYLVEMYTCTDMTPDETYSYLESKMNEILKKAVFIGENAVNDYYSGNYKLSVSNTDEILKLIQKKTGEEFPKIKDPGCNLTELPESLCVDGIMAYYMSPQLDSNAVNIARINKVALGGSDTVNVLATVSHETYPGHLYQTNYELNQKYHPVNSCLSYVAYSEGWADYASTFGLRWAGMSSKLADVYMIDYEIGQIMTAMIDIGVNAKGWGLDEIGELTEQYVGVNNEEMSKSYYNFVSSDPGIILSYPVGYFQLQDIRTEYKKQKGDSFEEEDFIKAYLDAGQGHFPLVKERILSSIK